MRHSRNVQRQDVRLCREVVNIDGMPKALKEAVSFVRVDCSDSPRQDSDEAVFDADSVDEERVVTVGSFPVIVSDSSSQCENASSGVRTDDSSPQHVCTLTLHVLSLS